MLPKRKIQNSLLIIHAGCAMLVKPSLALLSSAGITNPSIRSIHDLCHPAEVTTLLVGYNRRPLMAFGGEENTSDIEENDDGKSPIEIRLEQLQQELALIEALEARNLSQIDSFVDEQDQWDSMEPEERALLESKSAVENQMELLAEQLVQLWMGQKSQEG